jgi:hypothetical protein
MRASYWLLELLLFLFCSRRCPPEQSLKAFFSRAGTPIDVFEKLCLFVGLNSSLYN